MQAYIEPQVIEPLCHLLSGSDVFAALLLCSGHATSLERVQRSDSSAIIPYHGAGQHDGCGQSHEGGVRTGWATEEGDGRMLKKKQSHLPHMLGDVPCAREGGRLDARTNAVIPGITGNVRA